MAHIRLSRLSEEERRAPRGGSKPPVRDQFVHGGSLRQQLDGIVETYERRAKDRGPDLPRVPDGIQIVLKGARNAAGKPMLESRLVPKGWKLEVMEERQDGAILAMSPDPKAERLGRAINLYRFDARSPSGRRKRGTTTVLNIDEIPIPGPSVKMSEELLTLVKERPDEPHLVEIEIRAGSLDECGQERRQQFMDYLRTGGAQIVGTGPIVEEDYALFRAWVPDPLLADLANNHVWVQFIDLPPEVERQAIQLHNIAEADLPDIEQAGDESPVIAVLDGGVVPSHPLVKGALANQYHMSLIPDNPSWVDEGTEGHGTAVVSLAALGSLKESLLQNTRRSLGMNRVALVRLLDDNSHLPETVNIKSALPRAAAAMQGKNRARILNHSLASRARFNPQRMSVWAETIDRIAYDCGRKDGFLIIVAAGNIDGKVSPTMDQVKSWVKRPGYPDYLSEDRCRLRNPAQAINALTVGAYVTSAGAMFHRRQIMGHAPIAPSGHPSPFTRSGPGFLGEIKPEVVEDGGNWYEDDSGRLITTPQPTDVPVASSAFATEGRLVGFTTRTSVAAPRVAHLAARILEALPSAGVDLVRALIVNCAEWPDNLNLPADSKLRLLGYGVPRPDRALSPRGSRCIIIIEEQIGIGRVQYFRVPFPTGLFQHDPDIVIRVSVTLSYRAPVRKTNLKYRGTILEWRLSKPDESLWAFQRRCATLGQEDGADSEDGTEGVGDWAWTVKKRQRTRGTAQKDWFEASASRFGEEFFLAVIGRAGWLSKQQQEEGFRQHYAVAISLEAVGVTVPIPLHERIEALVRVRVHATPGG